jgi:hypothetical protein
MALPHLPHLYSSGQNMSQYFTILRTVSKYVTIVDHCSARLLSDEWAVLQKEVNGVEDVPCRRVDAKMAS